MVPGSGKEDAAKGMVEAVAWARAGGITPECRLLMINIIDIKRLIDLFILKIVSKYLL
jgi:hypothetical protein